MALTLFPFTPNVNTPFQFQPVLDGVTYNAVVYWNFDAQRYYINLVSPNGVSVFFKPLTGSTNPQTLQLQTQEGSIYAILSLPGSTPLFLVTQSGEFITTDNSGSFLTASTSPAPVGLIANGTQISSTLLPPGTSVDLVAATGVVVLSAPALTTGIDESAVINSDINLAAGYFTTSALVYRTAAVRFEVYDIVTPATLPGQSSFTSEGQPISLVSPFPLPPPVPPPPPPTLYSTAVSPSGNTSPPLGPFSITANVNTTSGVGINTSGPSTVVAFVTMLQNALVAQPPGQFPPAVAALASTSGLFFTRRSRFVQNPTYAGTAPPASGAAEIWFAQAAGPLTGELITASFTGGITAGLLTVAAFSPSVWDANVSLPAEAQATTTLSLGNVPNVSTTSSSDLVLTFFSTFQTGIPEFGGAGAHIAAQQAIQAFDEIDTSNAVTYYVATAPLINAVIGTSGGQHNYWIAVVDALVNPG
jgi:hypothetical protein